MFKCWYYPFKFTLYSSFNLNKKRTDVNAYKHKLAFCLTFLEQYLSWNECHAQSATESLTGDIKHLVIYLHPWLTKGACLYSY